MCQTFVIIVFNPRTSLQNSEQTIIIIQFSLGITLTISKLVNPGTGTQTDLPRSGEGGWWQEDTSVVTTKKATGLSCAVFVGRKSERARW